MKEESIWVMDFPNQLIREKVMMDNPDDLDFSDIHPEYQGDAYNQYCREYNEHIDSRRSYPYPVSKEQDGKEIPESNFVIMNTDKWYWCKCENCGWEGSSEHCGGGRQIADTGDYEDAYCPKCQSNKLDGEPTIEVPEYSGIIAIPIDKPTTMSNILSGHENLPKGYATNSAIPIDNISEIDRGYEEGLPEQKDEGKSDIFKTIYEMCVIDIPYYAYGDNEAACQLADQLNHVREFIVYEVNTTKPTASKEQENDAVYWKKRCEAAEKVYVWQLRSPDSEDFHRAFGNWQSLLKSQPCLR